MRFFTMTNPHDYEHLVRHEDHDIPRPKPTRASPEDREKARELAMTVAAGLDEAKCEEIVILDVHDFSELTDYIVIASGASDRQLRTASQKAMDAAAEVGRGPCHHETDPDAGWMVIDFIDVMVHIFEPDTRALYDLEMLWGDAPRFDWPNEASPAPPESERP